MRAKLLAAVLLLPVAAATAGELEVRLTVSDDAKVERKAGTVTGGVPFAKGTVKALEGLSVSAGGKPVPAQFEKLAVWEDGSVRWALLDCQADVPAGGKTELVLRGGGKNPAPAAPVKVTESDAEVKISAGGLEVTVPRKKPGLLAVKLDGKERIGPGGRGLVLCAAGQAGGKGPGGEIVADAPTEVTVEQPGPLRATVCVRGKFPGVHEGLLGYTARISAFAGQQFVKVHLWIENAGGLGYRETGKRIPPNTPKVEWLLFDGLCVELGVPGATAAACEGAEGAGKFKLLQVCHLAKGGRAVPRGSNDFFSLKDFEYTVTGADAKELKKGERTDGVVEVKCEAGGLTAAIRDFWQNYEKGMELDAAKLRLWLWPTEGQWPRERRGKWDGLRDADLQKQPRPGLYQLPGATHKGHEFILDLSGRPAAQSSAELSRPLLALAPPEYYAATGAAPALFAPAGVKTGDGDCDEKLAAWDNMARSLVDEESPTGFWASRRSPEWSGVGSFGDTTYWFGWMDFGDVPVTGQGPSALHPDWLLITLLGAMRTGDVAFMRLGTEMGRHRADIDQLWSDRDPPWVNRLQRGNTNFPALHCSTLSRPPGLGSNHLAGTVLYYMLTGERKSLECARRNSEGMIAAWEHVAKVRPWAGPQGDMPANAWSMHGYCAMYALTAERKWLDLALGLFRAHVVPKWKYQGSHLHDVRQIYQQEYAKDDIRYCHSIMPFCLLHRFTGDAQLLEMLRAGSEREFPQNYFDAPLFLADMDAYVALCTGKAEYADRGIEHWLEASPDGKCPPVWLADSSTWGMRSPMHLRTGHLLAYYCWLKSRKALPPGTPPAELPGSRTPPAEFPAGDGPLVLEVEDFCLERGEVKALEGAGGGKAVLFEYLDGRATRKVKLPKGDYRLTVRMYAPDNDSDALFLSVLAGRQVLVDRQRTVANGNKSLVNTNSVDVTVEEDGEVVVQIDPADINFQLDSVEIAKAKKP